MDDDGASGGAAWRELRDALSTMADLAGLDAVEVSWPGAGGVEPVVAVVHQVRLLALLEAVRSRIIQVGGRAREGRRVVREDGVVAVPTGGRVLALYAPAGADGGLEKVAAWLARAAPALQDLGRAAACLDALGDGPLVVDGRGVILHAAPRASVLLGVPADALEDAPLASVLPTVSAHLEPTEVTRGTLEPTHPGVGFQVQHRSPGVDGSPRPGVVVRLRSQERYTVLRKAQMQLLSALRHDVRSPLTSVRGLVGVLVDEPDMPRDERVRLVELLRQEAERTVTWVEDYLVLLRLRFEPRPLQPERVRAEALARELEHAFAEHARERHITLELDLDPAGLAAEVKIDRALVEPFGKNLLGHIFRLGDEGARVRVGIDARGALVVEGEGPGLFAAHPPNPFTTLARSTAAGKRTPGVGLGLFLVKKIADVHGWAMTCRVEPPGRVYLSVDWAARP